MTDERVRISRVAGFVGLFVLVAAALMAWPAIRSSHGAKATDGQDAQPADDATQAAIVRAVLHQAQGMPKAGATTEIYFDTKGANFCSVEPTPSCGAFEFAAQEPSDGLMEPGNYWVPMDVQRLVVQLTVAGSRNAPSDVPGVVTMGGPGQETIEEVCAPIVPFLARSIRIGRAAVHTPDGRAMAMVEQRFCDMSGSIELIKFERSGDGWEIVEGVI